MNETPRSAVVTGGSTGIGLAIAEMLCVDGYSVTIAARSAGRLATAAARLRTFGGMVNPVMANLARRDDIDSLVAAHEDRFGRTDVLVNNAGVGMPGTIEATEPRRFDLQLDLNLRATYLLMRGCIPMLRKAGAEHGKALIVNVSSLFGRIPQPGVAAYSATKAALVALSHSAHGELSPCGIQVTALCPGFVDTPGTDWIADLDKTAMIRPADVAEAVRFLLCTSARCVVPDLTMVSPSTNLFRVDFQSS